MLAGCLMVGLASPMGCHFGRACTGLSRNGNVNGPETAASVHRSLAVHFSILFSHTNRNSYTGSQWESQHWTASNRELSIRNGLPKAGSVLASGILNGARADFLSA